MDYTMNICDISATVCNLLGTVAVGCACIGGVAHYFILREKNKRNKKEIARLSEENNEKDETIKALSTEIKKLKVELANAKRSRRIESCM